MILLFYFLITLLLSMAILFIYDRITTYYFVKTLSIDELKECLDKCNNILEELNSKDIVDEAYVEEMYNKKDLYMYLIHLKYKQLGIKDEIYR